MRGLCTSQLALAGLVVAGQLVAQGGQLRRRPRGHGACTVGSVAAGAAGSSTGAGPDMALWFGGGL